MSIPTLKTPEYVNLETVETLQDNFAAMVRMIMAGNFVISLILAIALQYMWGMINSLQIIVLSVLFKFMTPLNAQVIQVEILKACAFDLFKTDIVLGAMFDFPET